MAAIVETYNHAGKIAVVLELACNDEISVNTCQFKELAKDVAMHIAASNPISIQALSSADVISIDTGEKIDEANNQNESLLTQPFVKDPDLTVGEVIKAAGTALNTSIRLVRFARFEADRTACFAEK